MEFLLVCGAEHLCGASESNKNSLNPEIYLRHMNSLAYYLRDDAIQYMTHVHYIFYGTMHITLRRK